MTSRPVSIKSEDHTFLPYKDDEVTPRVMSEDGHVDTTSKALYDKSYGDTLIYSESLILQGEEMLSAKC